MAERSELGIEVKHQRSMVVPAACLAIRMRLNEMAVPSTFHRYLVQGAMAHERTIGNVSQWRE